MKEDIRCKMAPCYRPGADTDAAPYRRELGASLPQEEALLREMLRQIRRVLENDRLDDFDCIEEIVRIYNEAGCRVNYRHDFG